MADRKALVVAVTALVTLAGQAIAQQEPRTSGPDIIVGDLHQITRWGAVSGITAYSVGTISCNVGTQNVEWIANNNRHPVIGQNMYRLLNGRFEMIGGSWLKHGFTALTESLCNTCSGQGGAVLGVGCSDPYGASLNGNQSGLGPKYQVNAFNGAYPYPVTGVPAAAATIGRRLQVLTPDITPANNPGAMYWVEGHYVSSNDAAWNHQLPDGSFVNNGENNTSYRRINIASATTNPTFVANNPTRRRKYAPDAWKEAVPAVTRVNVRNPGEGLFAVGFNVTQNGNGTWHWEVAIQNVNSDKSCGSFSLPVGCGAVSNMGFTDVFYHSGEPFNGENWVASEGAGRLTWRTTQTFSENANANALRWGTMYSFRFDSARPPVPGTMAIGLFKTTNPANLNFAGLVPAALADMDLDGTVDFADYEAFVVSFETGAPAGDFNVDGSVDFFDYDDYVGAFELGC